MAKWQPKNAKEFREAMLKLAKRNEELIRNTQTSLGPAMLQAGWVIANRAKEIIKENGHVVTGNLGRSITPTLTSVTKHRVEAEVGSFIEYAPYVEALPDGGYLNRAFLEKKRAAVDVLIQVGILPHLKEWGES